MRTLMNWENKKQLYVNIIKFITGTILLSIVFIYIRNHPAERSSRTNGLDSIGQRIQQSIEKSTGTFNPLENQRQEILRLFEDIVYIDNTTNCLTGDMRDQLNQTIQELRTESIEHFQQYKASYIKVRNNYMTNLKQECL